MTQAAAARIDDWLGRMTLAEKLGQMTLVTANVAVTGPTVSSDYLAAIRAGKVGTVINLWGAEQVHAVQRVALEETRLGIPLLFSLDALHGHKTVFPIPLAEAAAFDPELWQATARAIAAEAAADGIAITFAPMLDVARDPRWGRIAESAGEDTWLTVQLARAKTAGFQGAGLADPASVAACAKHLAAYGAATAGRDYAGSDISDYTLYEIYLPPFAAAVAAGAALVMPAFQELAGVPLTAHCGLLRATLRQDWRFNGVIVSDYNAIVELIAHGYAADLAEAAALALDAGVDIDLMGDAYAQGLPEALARGRVTLAQIDAAVRRILQLKQDLGVLDAPFGRGRPGGLPAARMTAHRALARDCARRAIVLLTNRNGILPLDPPPARLAVLGPLADAAREMPGPWSLVGKDEPMVSILAGLRAALPDSRIDHAEGCAIAGEAADIAAATALAAQADAVILCLGEAANMSGEAACRADPGLPGRQAELARAVLELGQPVIVTLSSGRPLCCPWLFARADAVLATWFLGSEAGHAVADILTGAHQPTGRLPVSWPHETGQIPIFYNRRQGGRPADPAVHYSSKYLDLPVEPLFPFGHGLSYAGFAFGPPEVAPATISAGGTVEVTVEIAHASGPAGEAVALLFSHDPVASVARPVLELRGVARLRLGPGERGRARFTLTSDDLAFLGPDLAPRLESGVIELLTGPSADHAQLQRTVLTVAA